MPNRLAAEKSPYLLQHANNPVDWFPWGEEAFEKARRENKPIFLSIGYSTCHWCHVMERESFENDDIAEVMNREYVPIKLDREERPDIDRVYMTFVQSTTGSGGWPMSVFLDPQLRPFFGGTYFPPDNRYGRPGFRSLLEQIARAWKTDRTKIEESGKDVVEHLRRLGGTEPAYRAAVDPNIFDTTYHYFRRTFDSRHAGFGDAPKFPRPVTLNFLFRYYARTRNEEAREMAVATLRAMSHGGMYDQLGGGFHRYSVDERWFVPHFEKMLYDQAQLVVSYIEAFQITQDQYFAQIARETLDYVLRDMTAPEGAFYSAEDADSIDPADPSVKGEGAFYLWTAKEIEDILGPADAQTFSLRYGVEANGNVENDPHAEFTHKNILFQHLGMEGVAARVHTPEDVVAALLERAKSKLLAERNKRPRPYRDDKILTAWNGLMISAFAKAAQVLDETRYLEAAQRAADFVLTRMVRDGKLLRRFRDGDAAISGFLDDYAFFIAGLLDLYEAGFDPQHLDRAVELAHTMLDLFEDKQHGALFTTAEGDSALLLRMKDDYDGAEPSGNSIAILDLLRLAHITDRSEFRVAADRALASLSEKISKQPVAVPQLLVAAEYSIAPAHEIVIAGEPSDPRTLALLRHVRARFLPHSIVLLASDNTRPQLEKFAPNVKDMHPLNGHPAAFVCKNYQCQLPTSDVSKLDELLQ